MRAVDDNHGIHVCPVLVSGENLNLIARGKVPGVHD